MKHEEGLSQSGNPIAINWVANQQQAIPGGVFAWRIDCTWGLQSRVDRGPFFFLIDAGAATTGNLTSYGAVTYGLIQGKRFVWHVPCISLSRGLLEGTQKIQYAEEIYAEPTKGFFVD
jgi:hypothetical protein